MPSPSHLLASAHRLIQRSERILLVADGSPDGDSIGSTTAMLNWLAREGKQVEAFSIEPIPSSLQFLDGVHRITNDPAVFAQPYDLVLTFDASDPKRSGITEHLPKLPRPAHVVVFDHHVTNPRYGDTNIIFTDACSTCEVMYRFFDENGERIDDRMATSLLTGITTDTSSFTNGATTTAGMEAAAHLFRCGARHTDIVRHVVQNKSMDGLKLWGLALSRLRHDPARDLATTFFLREDLTAPGSHEAVEGLSNFLNAVCNGCDTVLVLREKEDGTVRGSMRSMNRDISKLAQLMGGGGHKKAAGFTVKGRIEVTEKGPRIVN
ncbi:DHH family phosphoesterase [Candidatus Uhrbacteria bacterium]|nr:DHH family phosphoesterase [Candidatus Uhrbacteria bacterium]